VNKVARMPALERADLFAETAARKGLPEAIIEKDFWVCWMKGARTKIRRPWRPVRYP
jgi:hypothetical protein